MIKQGSLSIACIGEAMIELSFNSAQLENARVGYAGDTLNTAIYLRRNLQTRHKVSFVTAVGYDRFSEGMTDFIDSENVNTDEISRIEGKFPGLYAITTDAGGERSFSYWRENSAARLLFQKNGKADFSPLEKFDVLYYSAITLAILPDKVRSAFLDWLPHYRQNGDRLTVFDSNYRPLLWANQREAREYIEQAWKQTDIALPSIDDEMAVFADKDEEALLHRFQNYNIQYAVLKRGDAGPVSILHPTPEYEYLTADTLVDTTAAGDSFSGAFLANFLDGSSLQDAMIAGHNQACKVIAFRGAILPKDGS